ncbi:hypothetical protein [Methylorubrum extorquens]|uniref:hypothetical protein n=1 Tax=Methylorubrum extorquens TaxID=408 RepID=UPI0022374D55|nr:hypothetical protein [Methylorubrum extorquens]UYW34479.1 hypothetical protein OKB92_10475 [Methylorubrum extorquens]
MGPNALQFTEIEAWARITRRRVKRWELSALLAMDRCFRDVVAEQMKAEAST